MNLFGNNKKEITEAPASGVQQLLDSKAIETTTRVLATGVECINLLQEFPQLLGQLVELSLKDVPKRGNPNFSSDNAFEVSTPTLLFRSSRAQDTQLLIINGRDRVDINRLHINDIIKNTGRFNAVTLAHIFQAAIELPDLYYKVNTLLHEMPSGYFDKLGKLNEKLTPLIIDTKL